MSASDSNSRFTDSDISDNASVGISAVKQWQEIDLSTFSTTFPFAGIPGLVVTFNGFRYFESEFPTF